MVKEPSKTTKQTINICNLIQCPYYLKEDLGCQFYTTPIFCHLVGEADSENHRANLIEDTKKFFLKMNLEDYPLDSLQAENDNFFLNNDCYKTDLLLKKNGLHLETPNRVIKQI